MSSTAPTYDLNAETITEITSCIMWDQDFIRRSHGLIKPAYFDDEIERGFVTLGLDFYEKYREAPSATAWVELIREGLAAKPPIWRDDQKLAAIQFFKDSSTLTVRSRLFLLDKIAEFAKQQALMNGLIQSANLIGNATDTDRFSKIERVMKLATSTALNTEDEDYDYFAQIAARTADRLATATAGGKSKDGIPTGIKELDEILFHGGFGRKELSVFMGGAKAGKSFLLATIAANAVLDGKRVLVVSLEVSTVIYAARFDARFSEIGLSKQLGSPHAIETAVQAVAAKASIGTLKIRERPAGTFTPSDLRRLIDEYKVKGIYFDVIVVDYLDIMRSDHVTDSPIENSKSVWVDCRAIAQQENVAFVTATQTNREGFKAAVAKAEHAAEDFNKIRIADIVISVNRTDDERAQNKLRLFIAASRNQKDAVTLFCKSDFDKGNAVTAVESVE